MEIKGIEYEYKAVHLAKGEQLQDDYKSINSLNQVPALIIDGLVVTQSLAIMEFLEESFPSKTRILPADLQTRAKVREISEVINSGTQPIQNLAVLKKHSAEEAERKEWARYWIEKGLQTVERLISKSAGKFCVGDNLTMADCCLVPQVYNANRFSVNMTQFPTINRVLGNLEAVEAVVAAHPDNQPDKQ